MPHSPLPAACRSAEEKPRSRSRSRRIPFGGRRGVAAARTPCWFGRQCTRSSCWFAHPQGREVDERGRRRRSPSPRRSSPRSDSGKSSPRRSSSSRSSSPEAGAELSFKAFVRGLGAEATPRDALAGFRAERLGAVQKRAEAIKGSGYLLDFYHPASLLRRYDLRIRTTQQLAEAFLGDYRQGKFAGFCLRAEEASGVMAANEAPFFALEPDENALVVEKLPQATSAWSLLDLCAELPGFAGFAAPKPASERLPREVRARFASAEDAQRALEATREGLEVRLLKPGGASAAVPRVPAQGRVLQDLELSARAVCLLDALNGVPQAATDVLLGHEGSEEARLDLQVLYLRRAHLFCFYTATWCDDEWELRRRCGAAVLREEGLEAEAWGRAHEARLERFLGDAEMRRPPCLAECQEQICLRSAEVCKEHTLQAPGKWRCTACGKSFKGEEYVHKHLQRVHTKLFEDVAEEVYQKAAMEAFVAEQMKAAGFEE